MNRFKALFALVFCLVFSGTLFAQTRVPLTINASEGPAQVILSGKLLGIAAPNFTAQVAPGRYELVVRKAGLPEFKQMIEVPRSGLTVNAPLGGRPSPQPQAAPAPQVQAVPAPQVQSKPIPAPAPAPVIVRPVFQLTVTANAPNAQVVLNGANIGNAPAQANLEEGNYQLTVSAPGYESYSAMVSVKGNTSHSASLRQILNRLSVTANPNGAEVFLNGVKAGNAPFAADLAPGSYNLRVTAPGYQEYSAGIVMNGPQNVNVGLVPMMASISVSIPDQFLNKDTGNAAARVDLYIDGAKQNGLSAQVSAGQRRIRLVSGGLSVESSVVLEAGRSYTIEPSMGLNIK